MAARTIRIFPCAVLIVAMIIAMAQAFANVYSRQITLYNDSDEEIVGIYASNIGSADWEENLLGSDVLQPHSKLLIHLDDGSSYCMYDLVAVFKNGARKIIHSVNVCTAKALAIKPTDTPAPQTSPLDAMLDKLVAGNIAFNTPEHVRLGKPQIVEAKLAVNFSGDELIAQLNEAGKKEKSPIQVADRMTATLSGGAAFDVSPSGTQQQFISHAQVTTWTWEVTAKQPGTQYLLLSVDAVLTIDGKEGTRNINTFKRTIEVEVAWPETTSEWFQWVKEWFENIAWLWATVLVPIGLWVWSRFRKKPHEPGRTNAKRKRASQK